MIKRTVNLNPNYDQWDDQSRHQLLDSWRRQYYENSDINMSPIEGTPQGGQGYFDSQLYQHSLELNQQKAFGPTDPENPVNKAFQERQDQLNNEFEASAPPDRERLSHLIEAEKDAHDYWQKNELYQKVLSEDDNGNMYPKELVDEVRFERKLSEENHRASMEDLINYDKHYNHPICHADRDFHNEPVSELERREWCERKSFQGHERIYTDENNINLETAYFEKERADNYSNYIGAPNESHSSMPKAAEEFYKSRQGIAENHTVDEISSEIYKTDQKRNRVEGQTASDIDNKINDYNAAENKPVQEKRDERIESAEKKVDDVIPTEKPDASFKEMAQMEEEKGFFSTWMDKAKERVSDFKDKAVNLWEDRVAPKLGIETEKSRREAHQEAINEINRKEIRDFDRQEKLKEESKQQEVNAQLVNNAAEQNQSVAPGQEVNAPKTDDKLAPLVKEDEPLRRIPPLKNEQEHSESMPQSQAEQPETEAPAKRRRPTSGINDDEVQTVQKVESPSNETSHKNRPSGESAQTETPAPKIDDEFSNKIK